MFGLSVDQYNYILKTVVRPLEQRGAQVWCFGSRARGDFKPFSDLDIMIEIEDVDISNEISEIAEHLSNSNFPYKVEIILLSQFAESYKPGYLKDRKPFASV